QLTLQRAQPLLAFDASVKVLQLTRGQLSVSEKEKVFCGQVPQYLSFPIPATFSTPARHNSPRWKSSGPRPRRLPETSNPRPATANTGTPGSSACARAAPTLLPALPYFQPFRRQSAAPHAANRQRPTTPASSCD